MDACHSHETGVRTVTAIAELSIVVRADAARVTALEQHAGVKRAGRHVHDVGEIQGHRLRRTRSLRAASAVPDLVGVVASPTPRGALIRNAARVAPTYAQRGYVWCARDRHDHWRRTRGEVHCAATEFGVHVLAPALDGATRQQHAAVRATRAKGQRSTHVASGDGVAREVVHELRRKRLATRGLTQLSARVAAPT